MTSPYRIERDRGTEEARQQLAVLQEKWPLAFPVQRQDVRPLAMGVARQVAEAMGWSLPYTLGVLSRWKMAAVYCQAVLSHDQRVALEAGKRSTARRRAWQRSSWRNLRNAGPRRKLRSPRRPRRC